MHARLLGIQRQGTSNETLTLVLVINVYYAILYYGVFPVFATARPQIRKLPCQAQPKLIRHFVSSSTRHPPFRTSSEIAGKHTCNGCMTSTVLLYYPDMITS